MKSIICFFLLSIFSMTCYADDNEQRNEGNWYVGGAYHGGFPKLKALGASLDLGVGYSFNGGYTFSVSDKSKIDIDAEYFDMGDASGGNGSEYYYVNATIDASSYSLNLKPRYLPNGSGWFVGGLLGLGNYQLGASLESSYESVSGEESGLGTSLGVELGYEANNFIGSVGYRYMMSSIDDVSTDFSTFYVGVRYKI
ncbi:outer membrane beta-barrel protein [Vibrio sonorensis]|uniref:outer membrane beta-barrel protein n=1 Tax=Vibrio sonorensis TaxID=1004316 RepID=UPI0008D96C2B|nr:outer membrane beta-barrel protein [Vibrio sonorensis]